MPVKKTANKLPHTATAGYTESTLLKSSLFVVEKWACHSSQSQLDFLLRDYLGLFKDIPV